MLDNERSRIAFETIQKQGAKIAFIIDAVLAYTDKNNKNYKEIVKEGVKEAIRELGLEMNIRNVEVNKADKTIPDDIFELQAGL